MIKLSKYTIALIVLVIISFAYNIIFLIGPSFYGDDASYLDLAYSVVTGTFRESGYIFSIRLMQFLPIALFYKLFGFSLLAGALWDIISFTSTLVIVYFIGKKLYNELAGLLSSLLLFGIPFVTMLAPTISDDITAMFLSSLSFLFYLYAREDKNKLFFFLSGFIIYLSILTTPEAAFMAITLFAIIIIDLIRKKISINKISLWFIYGIIFSFILFMPINYYFSYNDCNNVTISFSTLCRNPIFPITLDSKFYSSVGAADTIPSTDIDPRFYLDMMFPNNIIFNLLSNNIRALLNTNIFINNFSGFYFYYLFFFIFLYSLFKIKNRKFKIAISFVTIVIVIIYQYFIVPSINSQTCVGYTYGADCSISLVLLTMIPFIMFAFFTFIIRNDNIIFALLWFIIGAILLNYGPMHISLYPKFLYLVTYRLQRFFALLGPSTAISLGIVFAYFIKKGRLSAIASILLIIVLLISGFLSIEFCNNLTYYETYPQKVIANYLLNLPNTTNIYIASSFSNLHVYMDYKNPSRFYAYNNIQNCSNIPQGSYVVIPMVQQFNLDYTPNPLPYCPSWQLILKGPLVNNSLYENAIYFDGSLYYIPYSKSKNSSTSSIENNSENLTYILYNRPMQDFKSFNLTGVFVEYNNTLHYLPINIIRNVSVYVNKTKVQPNELIWLNVTYHGFFTWNTGNNATKYYLESPVINIHYYGVELGNQTGNLLVQNNGPWYYLINQSGEPHQIMPPNPFNTLVVHWNISATQQDIGKDIKICGGYFAAYMNQGGFSLFNTLAKEENNIISNNVINIVSKNCAIINVT